MCIRDRCKPTIKSFKKEEYNVPRSRIEVMEQFPQLARLLKAFLNQVDQNSVRALPSLVVIQGHDLPLLKRYRENSHRKSKGQTLSKGMIRSMVQGTVVTQKLIEKWTAQYAEESKRVVWYVPLELSLIHI